jgi:hypothetical protein
VICVHCHPHNVGGNTAVQPCCLATVMAERRRLRTFRFGILVTARKLAGCNRQSRHKLTGGRAAATATCTEVPGEPEQHAGTLDETLGMYGILPSGFLLLEGSWPGTAGGRPAMPTKPFRLLECLPIGARTRLPQRYQPWW